MLKGINDFWDQKKNVFFHTPPKPLPTLQKAGKFPKRNKSKILIWVKRKTEEMRKCMERQRIKEQGGSQTMPVMRKEMERVRGNRNSKRNGTKNKNILLLQLLFPHFLYACEICTSSAHVPPHPLVVTFPFISTTSTEKHTLLGKTYIIEKLQPAFWRTFTELDFVATGKEPKNNIIICTYMYDKKQ